LLKQKAVVFFTGGYVTFWHDFGIIIGLMMLSFLLSHFFSSLRKDLRNHLDGLSKYHLCSWI